jgi:hypothetical protein
MKLTEQASNKILEGEGVYKTVVEAQLDLKIEFKKMGKRKCVVNIYACEQGSEFPVFIVAEDFVVYDQGSLMVRSPDGLMRIPMELT